MACAGARWDQADRSLLPKLPARPDRNVLDIDDTDDAVHGAQSMLVLLTGSIAASKSSLINAALRPLCTKLVRYCDSTWSSSVPASHKLPL